MTVMVTLYPYQLDTPTIAGMSSSINEFRTDAYLLRTSGSLDAATAVYK